MKEEKFLRTCFAIMAVLWLACLYIYIKYDDYLYDDYLSEVELGNHYCEMVRAGSWPNYKDWDCHVDEDK